MKESRNRIITATILVLILALPALATFLPTAKAADLPTYSFLTVNPNPIGVGQTVSVNFWLDKVTPNAGPVSGDRWEDVTVTITKPDGTNEVRGPITLDTVASSYFMYTPSTAGKYYFKMNFPGQHIAGVGGFPFPVPFDNTYLASSSPNVELIVQQEQVTHWQDFPLPTGYWTRPLNAELRGVSSIASYWLGAGSTGPHGPRSYGSAGNYQPYGTAPDSAHVLWTREITFGGAVGGAFGDDVFYPGETYERKFQPPIIMNGRLYFNTKLGSGANLWDGAYCVDMNTGETIWYINSTNKNSQFFTFGQLLNIQTPNQHGVIPYLWSVQGSTYKMYDAFTGNWIVDVANVPSGSMTMGVNGEILIYTLNAAGNYMTLWNSTKAIYPNIDNDLRWLVTPTGTNAPNATKGYQWNVTIPDVPGSQSITKYDNEIIYARATQASAPGTTTVTDVAYDIKGGKQPVQLFVQNRTYEGSTMNGPMDSGVFTTFVKETMVWYGYNVNTGAQIWGPTVPYENAWGMYQPYADALAGAGKLIAGGYDGIVHCFDIKTGVNLWNYKTGSSGFETPYGTYPFKDNALTIADGKVYAATNEHSPNTPFFHGWRLHAIDLNSGQAVWNISFIGLAPIIADGRAVSLNYFDNRLYCFGTGPSETTVTASPKVVPVGNSIMIEGTVTDQSPGATGTPAIADENQAAWMEYLYEQRPMPTGAIGVPVTLTAIDANGVATEIGTVVSDSSGMFKKLWAPQTQGEYVIVACFDGTNAYGSSYAQTALGVTAANAAPTVTPGTSTIAPTSTPTMAPTVAPTGTVAPSPTVAPTPGTGLSTETLLIAGAAVVIIIAVIAAALVLRKRK